MDETENPVQRTNSILVVEDDPQVAEIIQFNLRAAGLPTTVVADGLEAMHALDRVNPALVTMDLNVPEVSGFRLLRVFKKYAPHVPVIVVTASQFQEAEETAYSGADDFITKPFDPEHLVKKVKVLLERSDQSPLPQLSDARILQPAPRGIGVA
jgi:DNA-binding response OmpR family regulator